MFNDEAFLTIIKGKGLSPRKVAEIMDIDTSTLYKKRKGLTEFTLREMERSRSVFSAREMQRIFFA